jgi:alpha-galactosidase
VLVWRLEFCTRKLEHRNMILTARFSDIDFVPDGDLDKKAWDAFPRVRFIRDAFRGVEYPEIETEVSSLWTHDYLYLAFWCRYETLHTFANEEPCAEGNELWTRDVVEAFIAPEKSRISHYYEVEVTPDNRALELDISFDGLPRRETWQSGFEHATRINSDSKIWTVEMRIPVRSMCAQIVPGVDWRANLCRADGAGSDEQRRLLSWAPLQAADHSFHQPESFGILRFAHPED